MDLGTMRQKLNTGKYVSAVDFVKDLKLIWRNCMTYNAVRLMYDLEKALLNAGYNRTGLRSIL